ncbi:hypothetical protein AB2L57_04195 [Microbacterium sp. HA-8]|uniref:hypothetical protein n=1 Tax=Microbacterium sp. HA-8 TaxID=3234200 RepID=UPI0038F722CD
MKYLVTIADQMALSLTVLVTTVSVARIATPSEFGEYSVAIGIFLVCQGVVRAGSGEVVIVFSKDWAERALAYARSSLLVALLLGSICSTMILVVAALLQGSVAKFLLVLAVTYPLIAALDATRYFRLARDRPWGALVLDSSWLLGSLVVLTAGVMWPHYLSPLGIYACWGAVGACLGVASLVACKAWRAISDVRAYLIANRRFGAHYVADYLLMSGASQLTILVLSAASSLPQAGGVRGSQTMLGVVNVLLMAGSVVLLKELSILRGAANFEKRARWYALTFGAVGAALMVAVLLVVVLIPSELGELFFGRSWTQIVDLVPALALAAAAAAVAMGATTGLRAMGASDVALRVRMFVAPLTVAAVVLGFAVGGLSAALWSFFAASALSAGGWWVAYVGRIRRAS